MDNNEEHVTYKGHENGERREKDKQLRQKLQANFKQYMEALDFDTGSGEQSLVRGVQEVRWPLTAQGKQIKPMWLRKGLACERDEASREKYAPFAKFAPTSKQFHACCIVDKTLNGIELIRNLRSCTSYRSTHYH